MNPSEKASLEVMLGEMNRARPEFAPSKLWQWLVEEHQKQIESGIDSFKCTINQSYFNWIPRDLGDNQISNLLQFFSRSPGMLPLQARLEPYDRARHILDPAPLVTPEQAALYAFFVGLLWHFASQNDPYRVLERLSEPALGQPIPVTLGGKLISQDLANSAREFTAIMGHIRSPEGTVLRIAELGAGYGRLAYVFAKSIPCQYWIFDIPPALHLAQWYLSRVLPECRIFEFRPFTRYEDVRAEIERADICFFMPNQLTTIPDNCVDTFVSICSLQEMTRESVESYLHLMGQKTKDTIYLKQWMSWRNPVDKLTLNKSDYTVPGDWWVVTDRTDAIQDMFFETFFHRRWTGQNVARSLIRWVGTAWREKIEPIARKIKNSLGSTKKSQPTA